MGVICLCHDARAPVHKCLPFVPDALRMISESGSIAEVRKSAALAHWHGPVPY